MKGFICVLTLRSQLRSIIESPSEIQNKKFVQKQTLFLQITSLDSTNVNFAATFGKRFISLLDIVFRIQICTQ